MTEIGFDCISDAIVFFEHVARAIRDSREHYRGNKLVFYHGCPDDSVETFKVKWKTGEKSE